MFSILQQTIGVVCVCDSVKSPQTNTYFNSLYFIFRYSASSSQTLPGGILSISLSLSGHRCVHFHSIFDVSVTSSQPRFSLSSSVSAKPSPPSLFFYSVVLSLTHPVCHEQSKAGGHCCHMTLAKPPDWSSRAV